jgi:hypothetical protein
VLATIHRLLRAEPESFRPQIANLGFDREYHALDLAPLIPGRQFVRPNENKTSYR